MFACYQKHQFSIPSVLATRLRQRTEQQTPPLQRQRSLQNGGNPAPKIDYLQLPTSLWTSKGFGDEFLEGNAVRVSPYDDKVLYATNWAGSLRVLSASNGKSIDTVKPSPRTLTDDGTTSTWSLSSNSGMSFGSFPGTATTTVESDPADDDTQSYNDYLEFLLNNGINQDSEPSHFVVYSIMDHAPDESRFLPKTRVVCVSIPEHKILWTSAGLPGTPNGSPLLYYVDEATTSKDGDDSTGMFIVLTHNSVLIRPDNTTRTTGHLTVLDPLNGHVKWTQSEWSRDEIPKGYGPPQISHNPILGGGNSGGHLDNKNDVIVWTSADEEGRGSNGNLYSFQMKSESELAAGIVYKNTTSNAPNDPFEIRVLKKVRWNSIARPAMNRNGTNLFVGVTGNGVRGWNGIAKFNETANWSTRLVPLASNRSTFSEDVVVSTAPVLSADEERLFVTTVKNETVCLNAKDGVRLWAAKTPQHSSLLSEPKGSPDNQRLYIINSDDGRVHGINQKDGDLLWGYGCDPWKLPAGASCNAPMVSADFDLSSDGTVLYYGASDGRVVALTLGKRVIDNSNKGQSPSTSTTVSIDFGDEDRGPLEFDKDHDPAHDIVQASDNSKKQRWGAKIAGSIAAIIVCLAVIVVSVLYVARAKGIDLRDYNNYRLPRWSKPGGEKRHSFVARVKGPDAYEDQIIASLSQDSSEMDNEFNTMWVDPTHSNQKYIVHDDESPTADRLSVLLGTSNRIAPISDNFGYGQAVLI